jgi:TatD DNase family protein
MTDTHCHLNLSPLFEDVENAVKLASETGVSQMIIIGTDLITSRIASDLSSKLLNCYSAVGVHPDEAGPTFADDLEKLIDNPKVVAIGECGLDYCDLHNQSETEAFKQKNIQKQLFGVHIKLAKKHNLPLSIHCRNTQKNGDLTSFGLNAYKDLFDTMEHFSKDDGMLPKFVLHCMSGDQEYLKKGLELGGYISFAGNVTYPSAQSLRDLLLNTPIDRLLFETDSPFLAPQGKRGTSNTPANVSDVYKFAANLLEINLDTLDKQVSENVKAIFRI